MKDEVYCCQKEKIRQVYIINNNISYISNNNHNNNNKKKTNSPNISLFPTWQMFHGRIGGIFGSMMR